MSKDEYEDIERYATQEKHLKNPDVNTKNINYWHAGDDDEDEGVWLNWYTNKPLPYLPWGPGRPHDSVAYNFLISEVFIDVRNETIFEVKKAELFDKR